jgi:ABC-type multidrug transport system fused ATPase/permease subunit
MPQKPQEQKKLISFKESFQKLFNLLKQGEVARKYIIAGIILSVLLMLVELYAVSLLFPIANGIITKDFNKIRAIAGIQSIISTNPTLFGDELLVFLLAGAWLYGTIVLKSILKYGTHLTVHEQSKKASFRIREIVFERYLLFGKQYYDKANLSHLNNVLLTSGEKLVTYFELMNSIVIGIISFLVCIIAMIYVSWQLTILALVTIPLTNLINNKLTASIRELSEEQEEVQKDMLGKVHDILRGIIIVKGFGKESYEKEKFSKYNKAEMETATQLQRTKRMIEPVQEIISVTALLLVVGVMAFITMNDPNITPAKAVVFIYMLMKLTPNFNNLKNLQTKVTSISSSLQYIEGILNDEEKHIIQSGTKHLEKFEHKIEFRNLTFGYTPDKIVLNNISFDIKKGEKVALVGPSGVGKSTIANLLLRIYDCPKETIFLDGVDIREYSLKPLKEKFAFVTQEVLLFNDTLRANILYGATKPITDERLEEVIKKVKLDELVSKLPEKYDSVLIENGAKLSGGEKQRISLARALIRDADIIVLDEPTSALDSKTEEWISNAIKELLKEKTVLTIAHRLSTIRDCNRIIVLEKGEIVEQGNSQELMEKKGGFFKYAQAQKF